jgi:periplasmic protein CpxP/Spy
MPRTSIQPAAIASRPAATTSPAWRRSFIASAVVLSAVALSLGLGATQRAQAADKAMPAATAPAMPADGHHGMHADKHEHGGRMGMGMLPQGRHLDRLLTDLKATDAQRTQIKQITDKARTDLKALHEQGRGLHEKAMALWTAPVLDAAEAEKHRQQMLAHHDQVSKRMTQAMLDVGNVLTPEQRAKAGELMKAQRERMGGRMHDRMHDRMPSRAQPGMDR